MYKIMLWDRNNGGCCSGVYEMFANDIDDFEKQWVFNGDEDKERFLRSKAGEMVTDYYSDHPDLNIVQYDENATIIETKEFVKENIFFELVNFYGCSGQYFAQNMKITLHHMKFKDSYYLLGEYQLLGVCREGFGFDDVAYKTVSVWGNPVLKKEISPEIIAYNNKIDEKRKKIDRRYRAIDKLGREPKRIKYPWYFESKNQMDFTGCNLETYCLISLREYDSANECDLSSMTEVPDKLIEQLLFDIIGEAG